MNVGGRMDIRGGRSAFHVWQGSFKPQKKQKHVALFVFNGIDIMHNVCGEQRGGLPLPLTSVIQVRYSWSIILSIAPIFENTSYKFHTNYLSWPNIVGHLCAW